VNIYINGEIIESRDLIFSPLSSGTAHGWGVFETIKLVEGKPVFLREHFSRLQKSCIVAGIAMKENFDSIRQSCESVIIENRLSRGFLKIMCLKRNEDSSDVVISVGEKIYGEDVYNRGLKLCYAGVLKNENSDLTYIKSTNYMENMLQIARAREKGYEEPIFINSRGELSEGAVSNIFFVKGAKIFTPSVECGLLAGIAREKAITLCRQLDMEVVQGGFAKDFYKTSDEIFITNSLMGVMPVCLFEEKIFNVGSFDITWKLNGLFNGMENTDIEIYKR